MKSSCGGKKIEDGIAKRIYELTNKVKERFGKTEKQIARSEQATVLSMIEDYIDDDDGDDHDHDETAMTTICQILTTEFLL